MNDAGALPKCFLHLPKCGGQSVHEALKRALAPDELSRWRHDGSYYAGFTAFHEMQGWARDTYAHTDEHIAEMRRARVVSGHFALQTLLRVAPAASIATVLREPRARLLSLYLYWRLTPRLLDITQPYMAVFDAAQQSLTEFLGDPAIARETDNFVCRTLLHGERGLSTTTFIDPSDVKEIASAAIGALDSLGHVGILELEGELWPALSQFYELDLTSNRTNVTAEGGTLDEALPAPMEITPRTLELLRARTAADAVLYEHALARSGASAPDVASISAAAFAGQLVRFGDVGGASAAAAATQAALAQEFERELIAVRAQADADLAAARAVGAQQSKEAEERGTVAESLRTEASALRARIADQQRVIEWLQRDGWPLVAVRGRLRHELLRVRRRSGRASNRPPDSPS